MSQLAVRHHNPAPQAVPLLIAAAHSVLRDFESEVPAEMLARRDWRPAPGRPVVGMV
jgi:hypothetical protein